MEKSEESLNEITDKKLQNEESINKIIQEILQRPRKFKDDVDKSVHPSYTNFKVPYHAVCQLRYAQKKRDYEKQFQKELNNLLNHQPTAYEAARLNRHLCVTTLWPPLHNREEIDYFQRNYFKMTPKDKKRLDFLMKTNII